MWIPTLLQLESKDAMRARGVPSPDEWDAVALTFAEPGVRPRATSTAWSVIQNSGWPRQPANYDGSSASLCRGTLLPNQGCRRAPRKRRLGLDLPLQLPRYFWAGPPSFSLSGRPCISGCGAGAIFSVGRLGLGTCANAEEENAIAPAIAAVISGAFMGEILVLAVFEEPKKLDLVPEGQGLILRHIALFGKVRGPRVPDVGN